jgi:meiotically up-regulated gene 157 (Mug157) protein
MIWHMSIIMRGLTTDNKEEMEECLQMLKATTGGKGLMHESFQKDNPKEFTRAWFSWANGLFGELVMKLYDN